MTAREDGETLGEYAARVSKQLEESERERRKLDKVYDARCRAIAHIKTLGLENVGEGVIALSGDVTGQHTAMALELAWRTGFEIRVMSYHWSQAEMSYADMMHLENGDDAGLKAATEVAVRRLMIAQRANAQRWLDEHPEPKEPLSIRD